MSHDKLLTLALESPNEDEALNSLRMLRKRGARMSDVKGADPIRGTGQTFTRSEAQIIANNAYRKGYSEGAASAVYSSSNQRAFKGSNDVLAKQLYDERFRALKLHKQLASEKSKVLFYILTTMVLFVLWTFSWG